MTLKHWLKKNNISFAKFEEMTGIPYQRIQEHYNLGRPISERNIIAVLKATNNEVDIESLRPQLKEILEYIRVSK